MQTIKTKFFDKTNRRKNIFFLLIGVVFVKMLLLNFLTPFGADDFVYATSTSVLDAFQQEYLQYMTWGGRSVVHLIVRIFLITPKWIFNVLNALVYTGLTLLIFKMANPGKSNNISLYLFIIFSIWLYVINYGQVILWLTGAANYLWGFFIILCFLLPYNIYAHHNKAFNHKYIPMAGMFFLGILAGWCNENSSGGAILFVGLILIYCKLYKLKIKNWMVSGFIGSIIGFLFMILAPGNMIRRHQFVDDRHILVIFSNRIATLTNLLRDNSTTLIAAFIVLITMQIVLQKDRKRTYISLAYFITSIATTYAMALSPYLAGRAQFGATIFMIIACAHCFASLSFDAPPYKIAAISFISILAFQFATSSVVGFYDIGTTKKIMDSRQRYIESQIANGHLDIIIEDHLIPNPHTKWNPRFGLEDFDTDPSRWVNTAFADKYGLVSIKRAE